MGISTSPYYIHKNSATFDRNQLPEKRLHWGGSFVFRARRPFLVDVEPMLTYGLSPRHMNRYLVGLAFPYVYTVSRHLSEGEVKQEAHHAYALKATLKVNIWGPWLLYGAYGIMNSRPLVETHADGNSLNAHLGPRSWAPLLYIGLGGYVDLKDKVRLFVVWVYNTLYESDQLPYANPNYLRIGFIL